MAVGVVCLTYRASCYLYGKFFTAQQNNNKTMEDSILEGEDGTLINELNKNELQEVVILDPAESHAISMTNNDQYSSMTR